jgi:hypothetical protein
MNLKFGWSRRSFLSLLGAASGGLFAPAESQAAGLFSKKPKLSTAMVDGNPIVPITSGLGSGDIYEELGITPLININGTVTVIGGSVMAPQVMELMRRGNEHFVLIDELEVAAGKFIAKLCKLPAGYTGLVTGGAAAAMVVGYAGMMTEDIEPKLHAVPDVSNFPRNEVIIQKSHRYNFDHQIRQTGAIRESCCPWLSSYRSCFVGSSAQSHFGRAFLLPVLKSADSLRSQLHRGQDTFCGDQFVGDVVIRRNSVTLDHRQSQMDQPRTVGVDFMRHGSDKG